MPRLVEQPVEIGIAATPAELRGRVLVSSVALLQPPESTQQGYTDQPPFDMGVVAPVNFREPTSEELNKVTDPSVKSRLNLLTLPLELGHRVLKNYDPCDGGNLYPNIEPRELVPGFVGSMVGSRIDQPNIAASSILSLEDRRHVGPHTDNWEDPDVVFAVANMGPGERYHGFSPYITAERMGGRRVKPRVEFMKKAYQEQLITEDDALMCWVRLPPPQHGKISAMSSLVCKTLHDGSAIGATAESTVILLAVDPETDLASFEATNPVPS